MLVIVNKGELADPKKIKICLKLLKKFSRCVLWPPRVVDEAKKVQEAETSAGSEFLSLLVLYSRLLADFLSHLGKWVKSNQI